ncbi:MAG: hypothetical protein ABI887_09870 [Burkholderiales bacterium]
MKPILPILTLLGAFAGCAATDTPTDGQPTPEPRQYRTGSNIPVKEPVALTPEEKEKQRQDARDAMDKITSVNPAPRGR